MNLKSGYYKSIKMVTAGLFLCLLTPWIPGSLSSIVNQEFFHLLGLGISLVSMIICLSAYNQSRMQAKGDRTRNGQYFSYVFFAGGLLELLLFLYYGEIKIGYKLLVDSIDVLVIIFMARLICVVCMLFLGFKLPAKQKPFPRWVSITMGTLYISFLMLVLYNNGITESVLSRSDPWAQSINSTHYVMHASLLLFFVFALAGIIFSRKKRSKEINFRLILGVCFCIISQSFILQVTYVQDVYFTFSMLFQLISYIIFQNIYYNVYIKSPLEEQKVTRKKLDYMAHYDETTGLGNRRSLLHYVSECLEKLEADGALLGLLVINISRFKIINDSLGYILGDQLLKQTGERLLNDQGGKEVFSLGGDRYAIVLTGIESVEMLHNRVYEILERVKDPIFINERELYITPSAGVSIYPYDGAKPDELLRNANTALYFAKNEGQDFNRYTLSMKREAQESLQMEHDIRKGLERNEFYLEYQPQMNLATGEVVGVEALVRWNHPVRGRISPIDFIPIAEECGLIVPLGEWVLKEACHQNRMWQNQGYKPLTISVNLSIQQFQEVQLAERIERVLQDTGLDPVYLELEITESTMFDMTQGMRVLERIKKLGVQISIDDFGTGYSSLHYLKNLPIDRLKIDQSFVRELMVDRNNKAIVSTITSMAKHLQLKVTAEGVENEDQLLFLQEQHCNDAQGYFFSRPLASIDFESRFLKAIA
ncbi:bifunctional diguanylate cyclase/phosphodiesterase [Paenibacillus polygoni]|uniref:Bifunctional diguanylate cyclase/phosphodiesterase n=1 Tax=Paenibacillus polygoni TaxID=3050112 RepID=A0ABY8X8H7_9BACL|nr:bifunctional diguanylate cyclase/phosphodiesterase [Paenibacillus polygoni]WIV20453.1 bifunctional diguanylate cyclase/phosphodiesterase [Paenibacillus polygoni]